MEVVIILFWFGLAFIPALIASKKGRSFGAWYVYGLFLFIFALVHSLLIKPDENTPGMKKCPQCSSIIPETAKICPACRSQLPTMPKTQSEGSAASIYEGDRELSSAKYQTYLVGKYGIERNESLGKFVISDKGYSTLEEAVAAAHEKELEILSDPNHVVSKGKIGPGKIYDYVLYGTGRVVVTHSSGYKKEFPSIAEANEAFKS